VGLGLALQVCAQTGPEPVDMGRGAWGRLAPDDKGRWWMVLTRFPAPRTSHLEILISTNHCRDWTPLARVSEPGRLVDNGHLLLRSDGTLLLAARSLHEGESYELPVYASTNEGRTWQRWSCIDAIEGPVAQQKRGLWEPFLFSLPDGRVSVIYSSEKHEGYSQVLSQKSSPDGGRTWGPEHRIVEEPGGGRLRPGMGVVTRTHDGHFLLVYEVVGLGRGQVHVKRSEDGERWPPGLGTPIPGHEAAPWVLALRDGRLLLTSCRNTLSISTNGGLTWLPVGGEPWPVRFQYTWPALYEIAPETILASRSEGPVRLYFCRIPSPARRHSDPPE
jgi:hypothetical protein